MIDDTKGTKGDFTSNGVTYGTCIETITDCVKVTQTSNPITAVLTINDKSISFGTLPSSSVTSYAERFVSPATTGGDQVYFFLSENYTSSLGSGTVATGIQNGTTQFTTDYDWESGIFYILASDGGNSTLDYFGFNYGTQSVYGYLKSEIIQILSPQQTSPSCTAVVSNAVEITLGGVPSTNGGKTAILAGFTPHGGNSLSAAAALCDVQGFDFQSMVDFVPSPSPFYQINNPVALTGPFNDPPPLGYTYKNGAAFGVYPFYYNPETISSDEYPLGGGLYVKVEEGNTSLYFADKPIDTCLQGGSGGSFCGGVSAAPGSQLIFTTQLVGISSTNPPTVVPLPNNPTAPFTNVFTWTDTFNGTSGGIEVSPK